MVRRCRNIRVCRGAAVLFFRMGKVIRNHRARISGKSAREGTKYKAEAEKYGYKVFSDPKLAEAELLRLLNK